MQNKLKLKTMENGRLGILIMIACFLLSMALWYNVLKSREKPKTIPEKGVVKFAGDLHLAEKNGNYYKIAGSNCYISEGYFVCHLKD